MAARNGALGNSTLKATGHVQLLGGGSCRSSRLFLGERLDCLAGPRLHATQDMRWLVGQGEDELVAVGGSRRIVGLEFGGFALEGGVECRELRDGCSNRASFSRTNDRLDRHRRGRHAAVS